MLSRTDFSPYWFFTLAALVAVALVPHLDAAAPEVVPTGVAVGEHISAVAFPDSATVVLAIARDDGSGSRLAVWHQGQARRSIPMGAFAVNRLEFVAPDQLVASGALGETYSTRVYRQWRSGAPQLVWDSTEVPVALDTEQGIYQISPDGRFWGLLKEVDDSTVKVYLGELPEHQEFFTVELKEAPPQPLPITSDFPQIHFLESPGAEARFALAWHGRVRILEGTAPATRAVVDLAPDTNPQGLHWADGRLWIEARDGLTAVDVPARFRQGDKVQHLAPGLEISRQQLGFAPVQVVPRADGSLTAVSGSGAAGPPEVGVLRPVETPAQMAMTKRLRLDSYHSVIPSEYGNLAVALPDGWGSPVMHWLRF